jgi:hypothetical protein
MVTYDAFASHLTVIRRPAGVARARTADAPVQSEKLVLGAGSHNA